MPTIRRPIIGVLGSGTEDYPALTVPLGKFLASTGAHLLTGGGKGCMSGVSAAFAESEPRAGLVIGILPCLENDPTKSKEGYPNPWVELPLKTNMPYTGKDGINALSRNHINVLSCQALVALPGGLGTASEVILAIRYGTPIIAFLDQPGQISDLPASVPVAYDLEAIKAFLRPFLQA